MQIVKPIDIEDALRIDLAEFMDGVRVFAPPAPEDLDANCIQVMGVGGGVQSAVSSEYDVRVDCYAATEAEAIALACDAAGIAASLSMREPSSGRHYVTSSLDATPYLNPDPNKPTLPRASFRASVGIRGIPVF